MLKVREKDNIKDIQIISNSFLKTLKLFCKNTHTKSLGMCPIYQIIHSIMPWNFKVIHIMSFLLQWYIWPRKLMSRGVRGFRIYNCMSGHNSIHTFTVVDVGVQKYELFGILKVKLHIPTLQNNTYALVTVRKLASREVCLHYILMWGFMGHFDVHCWSQLWLVRYLW